VKLRGEAFQASAAASDVAEVWVFSLDKGVETMAIGDELGIDTLLRSTRVSVA